MLIWYANLPEETMWFEHRSHGSWGVAGTVLVFGHFLVPFGFLLSRHIKRKTKTLAVAAVFMLVMHWLDMQYQIMPTHHEHGMHLSWLDLTTMVGVVGVFWALTLQNIVRTPLIPERDPRLSESLRFHNI
jgi:uncharacterized membrane protein YpjA